MPELDANPLSRRRLLTVGATTSSVLVAGCLSGTDSEPETTPSPADETPTSSDDGTETSSIEADELPVTGDSVPELASLDEAMQSYMGNLDVPAGVLSVQREDELVFERGYGWGDREQTAPVEPDAVFRIGSISKLFTDEAILKLVDDGELSLDESVYPMLDVSPPDGELEDDRFREITVEHLLNHAGGWRLPGLLDPMYNQIEIANELDLDGPPDTDDVTRYMMTRPLQFDPGTDRQYTNFGYVLLGQVIEAVAGMEYQSYLGQVLFEPAGISDIEIGRTRPQNRHPDEIWYDDSEQCGNVFELDDSREYSCADYGFSLEAFDGAGGHVARPQALVRAIDSLNWLWYDGERQETDSFAFFGSHPGSFAYVRKRSDGTTMAALFNDRHPLVEPSKQIQDQLADAADAVDEWP